MQSGMSGRQYNLPFLTDVFRFPSRVVIDGIDTVAVEPEPQTEEDFFSSWDKPATPKPSIPSTAQAGAPVIGKPAPIPRTVTPSSLISGNTSVAGGPTKPRLTSSTSIATSSAASFPLKKSKLGGLGAKKAAAPIDFADAERKAAEEAERIKKLGYDRQREEEDERSKKDAEKTEKAKLSDTTAVARAATVPGKVDVRKGNNQDMERLGMGFKKLGFGAVPTTSASIPGARATCVFPGLGLHTFTEWFTARLQMMLRQLPGINSGIRRPYRLICISGGMITIPP